MEELEVLGVAVAVVVGEETFGTVAFLALTAYCIDKLVYLNVPLTLFLRTHLPVRMLFHHLIL